MDHCGFVMITTAALIAPDDRRCEENALPERSFAEPVMTFSAKNVLKWYNLPSESPNENFIKRRICIGSMILIRLS